MKRIYIILVICLAIISCKKEVKPKNSNTANKAATNTTSNLETITGEFLYMPVEKAAVLKIGQEMYGVTIDETMHSLDEQCKAFKKEVHDMIPVTIKGIKKPNPKKGGWEKIIEIKEIVSVIRPTKDHNNTVIIKGKE